MGEMLAATERAKGGRPSKTCDGTTQVLPSLKELKIGRHEARDAEALAILPKGVFDHVREIFSQRGRARGGGPGGHGGGGIIVAFAFA